MANSFTVQYDALGRPYFDYLDNQGRTQRSYVSPVAMDPTAQLQGPGESAWHSANQWNAKTGEVDNPYKWGKLITVLTAAGIGAGAISAAGGFGGAAGGGGGAVGPTASALDTVGYGTGAAYGGAGAELGFGAASGVAGAGAPALGVAAPHVIEGSGAAGLNLGAGAGMSTWADLALKYGLPALGNVIDTKMTTGANADALRIQQEYYNKALAAALEEQAYERKRLEEQTAYDRLHGEEKTAYDRAHAAEILGINQGNFGNYLGQLAPYRNAGTTALERMQAALSGSPWQPNNGVTRSFL